MYLPPLQPVANSGIRICGDVEIHPTASIAPGVILQAAPESRIIIGVDVCIGMGVIISAYGGVVEIANGVTLGSGVLIVGCSRVGSNACVGTSTTIFNGSIDAMAVITPGSIIGDTSRPEKATTESDATENTTVLDNALESPATNNNCDREIILEKEPIGTIDKDLKAQEQESNKNKINDDFSDPWSEKNLEDTNQKNTIDLVAQETVKEIAKSIEVKDATTIGKVYIDQLLVTLFPHKKQIDNNSSVDLT